MKFSERWLREWVAPEWTTEELCRRLTSAGLEVDAVEPVATALYEVVVGHVISCEPHPDADKLKVCRVDVGRGEPLQIVCGASNVFAGAKVPAALVGAELPGGMAIKKAKLRGVESSGMLCSAKELGLAESAPGLLIFPGDAPVGEGVQNYLELDDTSIELGITPNRGDCLSIAGIAREVAALSRRKIAGPNIAAVLPQHDMIFPVRVGVPQACPRYLGRVISGVNAQAATPLWMQEKLRRSGLRSISPIVDVTNYVLLELGQPMHAFDLARLEGGIQVRMANDGERCELLDGQTVTLKSDTLVIADEQRPVAMAGIMGGAASAVGAQTTSIFLESAHFAQAAVSGQARHYGLRTDSSHRFERGVDPELPRRAMERATALITQITGGRAGPIIDASSAAHLPQRAPVTLRARRLQQLLGIDLSAHVEELLLGLGMKVEAVEEGWRVTPPSYRFDIAIEADLVEEVGRLYGYDLLPTARPAGAVAMRLVPETALTPVRVRAALVDLDYQEAITYSFVDPSVQRVLDPHEQAIGLENPIAADMAVMRTTLIVGLVQALRHNLNRQQPRVRLFEIGTRFRLRNGKRVEDQVVAGAVWGSSVSEQWGAPSRPTDFFDIKGDLEALLSLTGRGDSYRFAPARHPALHPGRSAEVITPEGDVAGRFGAVHPRVQKVLDIDGTAWVFELSLVGLTKAGLPRFRELSKFPAIRRDIAVVVAQRITAEQVLTCARSHAGPLLQDLQLFDVYQGKGIELEHKSLALSLTLQDNSRTLTDPEVDALVARVVKGLGSELGASLRE